MGLSEEEIKKQSERAYKQWAPQWREHAHIHSKYPMKSLSDFEHSGIGKACLAVANGASLQDEIETIKKYKHFVDIICCDKSLGVLLDHGITPKFCMVMDANVSYENYLDKWKDKLRDIIYIGSVAANPKWSEQNWKDRYFICVMDVLKSENEFQKISGCPNVIVAGTNVSNALVIFLTQCDNGGRKNFFSYDKILLIGFDYCWRVNGPYYAFDKEGGGKHNYMRHAYLLDLNRNHVCSSGNLIFSAKWLDQYISAFKLPVVQCTRNSLLSTKNMGVLSKQMQYSFKEGNRSKVIELFKMREMLVKKRKEVETSIHEIARDHYYAYMQSVVT